MITLIEIAVYAVILSGSSSVTCFGHEHESVTCTSGLSATVSSPTTVAFSDGTAVDRNGGYPIFSNGIKSWLNSEGWVAFSTGVQIRRLSADHFKFSSGMECKTQLPNVVQCEVPDKASGH